jgi:biotin carboxyl carrier protein
MQQIPFKGVLDWMRTTDLVEVAYRSGEDKVSFRFEDAGPVHGPIPGTSLVPVLSPEVGIFRFNEIGKARRAEKDVEVEAGLVLGLVDTGAAKREVTAPAAGRLSLVLAEEGKAVEYGQPLFFIRPV